MRGDETLWNPGCDHAGIATQVWIAFISLSLYLFLSPSLPPECDPLAMMRTAGVPRSSMRVGRVLAVAVLLTRGPVGTQPCLFCLTEPIQLFKLLLIVLYTLCT